MLKRIPRNPRVVFVVPPLSNLVDKDGFVSPSRPKFPSMPEMMLASALRTRHPEVQVSINNLRILEPNRVESYKTIDYYGRSMDAVRVGAEFEAAREDIENADVVCISNNFTQNAGVCADLLRYAKECKPDVILVVGGSDVAARHEYYMDHGADIVVLSEGESRLPALIRTLQAGDALAEIPGLVFREAGQRRTTSSLYQGRYMKVGTYVNQKDPWATDMNAVEFPALDLVDVHQFDESGEGILIEGVSAPIMHFESSRGCHEHCTFCATPNLIGDKFRFSTSHRIRELLEFYASHGVKSLALNEDNLLTRVALDPENGTREVVEMFRHMRELGFAWEFDGGIQFGLLWDSASAKIRRELFDAMFYHNGGDNGRWVGCYRIYVPLERLADQDMRKLGKLQKFEVELELVREMARVGIPAIYLGIIVGVPTDTDETIEITRERSHQIQDEIRRINGNKSGIPHSYTWFSFFNEILIPGSTDWVRYQDQLDFDVNKYPELWNFHTSTLKRNDGKPPIHFHEKRFELATEFNGEKAMERFRKMGKYQPSDGILLLN